MLDDTTTAFCFPAVTRKKVTTAFNGGRITSDGGVMLLLLAFHEPGLNHHFDLYRSRPIVV